MKVTALPGYLQQAPDPAVLPHQRGELRKHRFPVHPAKRPAQLTAGDYPFGAGTVGHIRIGHPQAGHPVSILVKYRRSGNPADLENGFQGLPQHQLIALLQGIRNRPRHRPGHQLQIFPEPVIEGPLYRAQANVNSKTTENDQRYDYAGDQGPLQRPEHATDPLSKSTHSFILRKCVTSVLTHVAFCYNPDYAMLIEEL